MPAYEYTCSACQHQEVRITGIDDHTVTCSVCGQVMERKMDVASLLASYLAPQQPAPAAT
jgi:putative FmdB family regulatory protein